MALKGILILGKDPKNHKASYFEIYKDKPDYLIIDGSQELMTREEFKEKLQGHEIDSNTRVDILAHGSRVNEREDGRADHSIALLSDAGLTKDVLGTIAEHSGGKPIQAHLWSCYGGTAASAVENLPEGSIVMGHGAEKSITVMSASINAINSSIINTIRNHTNRITSIGQDLVDNIPTYIKQDLNIGIKGHNSEVETFHLDEASPNLSEVESIRGLFTDYNKQIISAIGSMKESGLLSEEIETPLMKAYSMKEIRSYEYDRTLFDLFLRSDFFSQDTQEINFSKLLRDGALISQEEGESLDLSERERKLLDPEFQKKLLDAKDINANSFLHRLTLLMNDNFKNRDVGIDYLVAIAKSNDRAEEYLSAKNANGRTPLIQAIEIGDKSAANNLIKTGIGLDIRDNSGNSPLLLAIAKNKSDLAKLLIENGADVNVRDDQRSTALIKAVNLGNIEIVKSLLDAGADINPKDIDGNSLLIYSNLSKNKECLELFIEKGLDINSKNNNGETLLAQAIKSRKPPQFIESLLDAGADVNIKDRNGKSLLSLAIEKNLDKSLVRKINERTEDPRLSKAQLFRMSIMDSDLDAVMRYVKEGVPVNDLYSFGSTHPYEYLSQTDNPEIARFILGKINANISSNIKLDTIIASSNLEVSKLLYENFTDLEKQECDVRYIPSCKNKEVARYLFSKLSKERRDEFSFKQIGSFVNDEVLRTLSADGVVIDRDSVSIAVKNWKFEECKVLVDSGYIEMSSLMIESFKQNKTEFIDKILETDFDPTIRNRDDKSVFDLALESNNLELVKKMIPKIRDVNLKDRNGESLLGAAIRSGNTDIAKILIGAGADVNVQDIDGNSPLSLAIRSGNAEMAKTLIAKGADVNLKDRNGESLLGAAIRSGNADIAKALVGAGADVNAQDMDGNSLLSKAIKSGNADIAKALVGAGADVNLKDRNGESLLGAAIRSGNADIAKVLVGAGIDIRATNKDDRDAYLGKACAAGMAEVVKILIAKGADVNSQSKGGFPETPLHLNNRSPEVARILLESGADVNAAPGLSYPPLTKILFRGNNEETKKIAKLYIEYGAHITKKKGGVAPIDKAREVGLEEFVIQEKKNYRMRRAIKENRSVTKESILGRFEGDPNGVDSEGKSMLSYAIEVGNLDAVKKLIKMGADVNSVSEGTGMRPLHEAARSGNKEIYNKLIQAGANIEAPDREGKKPSEYLPEVRVANAIKTSLEVSNGSKASNVRDLGVIETKNVSRAPVVNPSGRGV